MGLSPGQVRHGFWNWSSSKGWPPGHITRFEDCRPSELLSLNITQLDDFSASQQRKIVDRWCEELPNLSGVRYLWFVSRVNQKIFDAACRVPDLEGMFVKWSGVRSIDALRSAKGLRHLHLGSSSQVESIDVLGDLQGLATLDLQQLNRISDFGVLARLTSLEGLGIDGGMWKAQKIDTLEPLSALRNLKYLTLIHTRLRDGSFDPLLKLAGLIRFESSWNYPESEFEKLKSLPNLRYGNVETSWKEVKARLDDRLRST